MRSYQPTRRLLAPRYTKGPPLSNWAAHTQDTKETTYPIGRQAARPPSLELPDMKLWRARASHLGEAALRISMVIQGYSRIGSGTYLQLGCEPNPPAFAL